MHKPGSDQDSCEHANFHDCRCHDCSGTLHKWKGLLELAGDRPNDPHGEGRTFWIGKRIGAWEKRLGMISRQRQVVAKKRIALEHATPRGVAGKATGLARSENRLAITLRASGGRATDYVETLLVRSLVGPENETRRSQIHTLLTFQSGPVLDVLRATPDLAPADVNAFMSGVAGSHLWCGLLAAESVSLTLEALNAREAVSLFFSETSEGASFDNADAIANAVTKVWDDHGREVADEFGTQDEFKQSLQTAALFICPAPEAHSLLINTAVLPIVEGRFSNDPLIGEVGPSLTSD